ncbi:MAG: hypothetical protein LUQ66_00850 [Methanoregula sp.]|nr:hypothetical protein [Methanoregula sp.]
MGLEKFFEGICEGCVIPIIDLALSDALSTISFGSNISSSTLSPLQSITFLITCVLFAIITSSLITYWQHFRDAFENPTYYLGYLGGVFALLGSALKIQEFHISLYLISIIIIIILAFATKVFIFMRIDN